MGLLDAWLGVSDYPGSEYLTVLENHKREICKPLPPQPRLQLDNLVAEFPEMFWLKVVNATLLVPESSDILSQHEQMRIFVDKLLSESPNTSEFWDKVPIWKISETKQPIIALDYESSGLDTRPLYNKFGVLSPKTKIAGIVLASGPNDGYYLPVNHNGLDGIPNWNEEVIRKGTQRIFNEAACLIHNAQYDLSLAQLHGIITRPYPHFMDTQQLYYLKDVNRHGRYGLKMIGRDTLNRPTLELDDILRDMPKNYPKNMCLICAQDAFVYSVADGLNTFAAFLHLINQPDNPLVKQGIPSNIDHNIIDEIVQLYKTGVPVDPQYHVFAALDAISRGDMIYDNIRNSFSTNIDLHSPKQLSDYIYHELGIPPLPFTEGKTEGQYSTGEDVLESLSKQYPQVAALAQIVLWRKLISAPKKSHLKFVANSYVDYALPISRVKVDYSTTRVPTGRFSSSSSGGRERVSIKFKKDGISPSSYSYQAGDWTVGLNSQGISNAILSMAKAKRIKKNPVAEKIVKYDDETKRQLFAQIAEI